MTTINLINPLNYSTVPIPVGAPTAMDPFLNKYITAIDQLKISLTPSSNSNSQSTREYDVAIRTKQNDLFFSFINDHFRQQFLVFGQTQEVTPEFTIETCIQKMNEALSISFDNPELSARLHYQMAFLLTERNHCTRLGAPCDLDLAIYNCNKALALNFNNLVLRASTLYQLAIIYQKRNAHSSEGARSDLNLAIETYEQATALIVDTEIKAKLLSLQASALAQRNNPAQNGISSDLDLAIKKLQNACSYELNDETLRACLLYHQVDLVSKRKSSDKMAKLKDCRLIDALCHEALTLKHMNPILRNAFNERLVETSVFFLLHMKEPAIQSAKKGRTALRDRTNHIPPIDMKTKASKALFRTNKTSYIPLES